MNFPLFSDSSKSRTHLYFAFHVCVFSISITHFAKNIDLHSYCRLWEHLLLPTAPGMTSPQEAWVTTPLWPFWHPSCPQTSKTITMETSMVITPHISQWYTITILTVQQLPPPPTKHHHKQETSKTSLAWWSLLFCDCGVILLLMLVGPMLWLSGTCTYKYYAANKLYIGVWYGLWIAN